MKENSFLYGFLFFYVFFVNIQCTKQTFDLPPTSQNFMQSVTYNNKIDLLLVIDNSNTMNIHQQKLANQIPTMLQVLETKKLDYNIAVITTDMRPRGSGGKFIGIPNFISSSLSSGTNGASLLQERILAGENGSDLERGLLSLQTALSDSYLKNDGNGFIRSDALLAILILSDENDYSTTTPEEIISLLNSLKPAFQGRPQAWIVNLLGVLSQEKNCRSNPDFNDVAIKYLKLVDASGGIKDEICNPNLAQAVNNLNMVLVSKLTDFYFDRKPDIQTIKVYINGNEVLENQDNGWTYEETGNFIRFHGAAIPNADDKISVDFKPIDAT